MTEKEFDGVLRHALLEAETRRWASELEGDGELEWTPKRQRVMDRILADPFGYGKRRAQPQWRRVLGYVGRTAACLLLAGGLTCAVFPQARAWVLNAVQGVVTWWTSTDTQYSFEGERQGALGRWRLTAVPEGYREKSIMEDEAYFEVEYENDDGQLLCFSYSLVEQGLGYGFDNEHSDHQEITLNGQPAYLYGTNEENWPSHLVWFNEEGSVSFYLMAYVSGDEIVEMAESVELIGE